MVNYTPPELERFFTSPEYKRGFDDGYKMCEEHLREELKALVKRMDDHIGTSTITVSMPLGPISDPTSK